jgi:hypothetical protein
MKYILFIMGILGLFGCNQITEVSWEGAASRIVDKRLFAKVESMKKLKEISPSIAGYMPNPVRLVVVIIEGDKYGPGQKLALKMPGSLLGDINAGSEIAVGLVSDTAFTCVEKSSKESWKSACVTSFDLDIPFAK